MYSNSVRRFVKVVVVSAVVAAAAVFVFAPQVNLAYGQAVLTLGAIALLAQLLAYTLPRTATGSVSFVPYLAMAAIAPSIASVLATFVVASLGQATRPFARIKKVFNVAQQCLAISAAIMMYALVGGKSLLTIPDAPYLPLFVLFAAFMLVNNALVNRVVSLSERRRFTAVWAANSSTFSYDLLSWPIVLALAWVYVRFGSAGALAFAIPLLGLRQLYKVNSDLERANRELLELMVAAIEARDPYTSGHSRRVSENSRIIAEIIGLGHSQAKRIEIAGLMHDVGKIHEVFANILQKPGRLTDEEIAIMQTHPIKSQELVARVTQLRDIIPSVRHHHENWDGSGYPDQLSGDAIPLGARVVMVADTIDAMTSDRPYRRALSPEAVRQELIKWRGKQFDPMICDMILSSPRYHELFQHSAHESLPHTQEMPRLKLAAES